MQSPFWDGFEKQASVFAHGAELAGLGILARPALHRLNTGEELSEKSKAVHEVAGLGVLAAPSVHAAVKQAPKSYQAVTKGIAKAKPGFSNAVAGGWRGFTKSLASGEHNALLGRVRKTVRSAAHV